MLKNYPYLLNPAEYPDYIRRPFKVPTWGTFSNKTQFCALRSLHQSTWKADLDMYVDKFKLGKIVWPMLHCLYSTDLEQIVEEIQSRDLYLFDLWSYVPGSSMAGVWSNITPPPGVVNMLREKLGDRFLGMDNGEQDGRYVGNYAHQQCPSYNNRFSQYQNFHRHFARLGDDLDNHLSTLVSLCFGHYFLKEGNHALIGAETAQGLPNGQVYYSFIRGAGKQYGVPWFGNASVFNRWGWKTYDVEPYSDEASAGYAHGPEDGTSLRLLKRLIYTHILYNCTAVGFESSWLQQTTKSGPYEDQWALTPIGKMQASAQEWVEANGQPGVMHTPVAFLLDFFAGWAVPRHLYTDKLYQVWGAMPYQEGDYLTHALLSVAYPGYEDSSYYHDEKGFLTATPYGDAVDCVLSDIPEWILKQYPVVIAAGELDGSDLELQEKLQDYVRTGGQLVLTAANARNGLVPGVTVAEFAEHFISGAVVKWMDGTKDTEDQEFDLYELDFENAIILAQCQSLPAVIEVPYGAGSFVVLASEYGFGDPQEIPEVMPDQIDTPLFEPFKLLNHVRGAFEDTMRSQQIFEIGEGLGFVTCSKSDSEYTVGVYNNDLVARDMNINCLTGSITQTEELTIDSSESGVAGCWPKGFSGEEATNPQQISGGDIRVFRIKVSNDKTVAIPEVSTPEPVHDCMLSIRGTENLEDQLLARPTFFQNYDGIKLDYQYMATRSSHQIERESKWVQMQKLRTIVDLSSGMNFYPDLTLINDYPPHYDRSRKIIDDVVRKMGILGSEGLILSLHRLQENRSNDTRAAGQFVIELKKICDIAGSATVYLQHHPHRNPNFTPWQSGTDAIESMLKMVDLVDRRNFKLAINFGHLNLNVDEPAKLVEMMGDRLGLILLSSNSVDTFGQIYDTHSPISEAGCDLDWIKDIQVPVILDAVYTDFNEEYEDLSLLK